MFMSKGGLKNFIIQATIYDILNMYIKHNPQMGKYFKVT